MRTFILRLLFIVPLFAHFDTICINESLFSEDIKSALDPTNTEEPSQEPRPYDISFSPQQIELPWLTGPLLTASAHVIPISHFDIQPYIFYTTNYGSYSAHWHESNVPHFYTFTLQIPFWIGLTENLDIRFYPQLSQNHTEGVRNWVFNDLPFGIDIQLLNDHFPSWWPAIKLQLGAVAPIGKYQRLNPSKKGTDIGGTGSWNPNMALCFSRYHYFKGHFLASRMALIYFIPTPVYVHGLNTYGGGNHTHGKVSPGGIFVAQMGFEYTFTKHIASALDIQYLHIDKTRFRGSSGTTASTTSTTGSILIPPSDLAPIIIPTRPGQLLPLIPPSQIHPATVGFPSSEQFSLAAALEYNFNASLGLIAGGWFSIAGRNSAAFASAVAAFNYYY